MRPDWFPDWSGKPVVIVASGPSAVDHDLEIARGRAFVLTVNSSWRLAPWADALYACDPEWWESGAAEGFSGMRISRRDAGGDYKIDMDPIDKGLSLETPGTIGRGPNGGFQAANLVVQFGARRIGLVGFDASVAEGTHWHGNHPRGLKNPNARQVARWAGAMDRLAPRFAEAGVEVVNISATSRLTAYPRATLEAFLGLPPAPRDRSLMRVRFLVGFPWSASRHRTGTTVYAAGMETDVPRACGMAAIMRNAARRVAA